MQFTAYVPLKNAIPSKWRHAVLLMALSACSQPHSSKIRVGLITPGSVADAAWNSGAYQGLMLIRDSLGLAVSHVEARTPAEQTEALRTYAAQGYQLVFAHGFEFQDPAERVSREYPQTVFIVTSGAGRGETSRPSFSAWRRRATSRAWWRVV